MIGKYIFVAIILSLSPLAKSLANPDAHFAAMKNFLSKRHECTNGKNKEFCSRIQKATDSKGLAYVSMESFSISDEENRELLNRVLTMECCLSLQDEKSCKYLPMENRKQICDCRARFEVEPLFSFCGGKNP